MTLDKMFSIHTNKYTHIYVYMMYMHSKHLNKCHYISLVRICIAIVQM